MPNRMLKPEYLPTPAEIKRKCEEIRERWSESERYRRSLALWNESEYFTTDDDELLEGAEYGWPVTHSIAT